MRAVVYDRYGNPDVLRIDDVPMPSPGRGQVLVKVAATSVNLSDWETLRGSPLYSRLGGLRAPARRILGSDIAGRVDVAPGVVTNPQAVPYCSKKHFEGKFEEPFPGVRGFSEPEEVFGLPVRRQHEAPYHGIPKPVPGSIGSQEEAAGVASVETDVTTDGDPSQQ